MTLGEWAAVALVVLPLLAAIGAFVVPRAALALALVAVVIVLAAAGVLVFQVLSVGPWRQTLGGWPAPLGIAWHADGLSGAMLLLTAGVATCAGAYRAAEPGAAGNMLVAQRFFWPLWLFLVAGLNALFLSADLFNIYVAQELMGLSAVALIALAVGTPALAAAWSYLLATLLGSSLYLLGVSLLYGRYGVLDIGLLTDVFEADLASVLAAVVMTLGLLLKAAVFPLHFWLPAAHGKAPTAVSAVLSAVVVAAPFYLAVRLWLGPFAELLGQGGATLLGLLGVAAILWGGLQALLQRRLKMLIAYSTVSQFGFGMLVFPLAVDADSSQLAWTGAVLLVLAHGLAKAALFWRRAACC
nr:proton-conducting transporter membrane subunit [Alkalilimnicola ehrlichii]